MRIVVDGAARMARERSRAASEINATADEVRRRFVTPIAGQDMVYLRKEEEARRYLLADPEPATLADFPMLASEVGITAPTAFQLATIWLFMSGAWTRAAAAIEAARLSGIDRAHLAQSPSEIDQIVAETSATLLQIHATLFGRSRRNQHRAHDPRNF
ncbi:hypothetical protein [Yoonia sp.]|uniref:hypothetical protein n=1 Tax=Yoonia sp. TaxID=2212373 RepID=UPI002E0924B5|nr:hypothetical protein [Yoonia sp.]